MGMVLDLLVPLRCAACAAPARAGLCAACAAEAEGFRLPAGEWGELAPRVAAVGRYAYAGVIRDAVHGMKLGGRYAAARPLGDQLMAHVRVVAAGSQGWPVTWVPASPRRLRQRGFDLPRLLAGPTAIPLLRRALERPDQTSLQADQRRRSPVGAFVALGTAPRDVVLVDDVRTTGATALAAAQTLLAAGAARVLVVTLAVGGDDARDGTVR